MPHILIVSLHFPPDSSVGAKRALRMASHLPDLGWDTTVLTVRPGYFDRHDTTLLQKHPAFSVVRTHAITPLRWARYLRDTVRGWRIREAESRPGSPVKPASPPTDVLERPAPFWRPWFASPDEYAGWIPLALGCGILRRPRPDIIIASGPPFSSHLIAAGLSRALRVPLVLDYRDPWTFIPGEPDRPGRRPPRFRTLESWCVRRASLVIATTGAIARSMDPLHPPRTEVIPNAVDAQAVARIPPRRDPRFSIVYAGNFYATRSPRPFLEAIRLLKEQNALPSEGLVMKVFGATGDLVTRSAAALGVSEQVSVGDALPYGEALAHIRGADVLLLVVGEAHAGMVPAKLFDYLAARRFVLTLGPPESEAGRIVEDAGAGALLAPDDVAGIARCLTTRLLAPREDLPPPAILERYDARRTMEDLDRVLRETLHRSDDASGRGGSERVLP